VQLQVQVRQDPQKSVFGLLAQAMVVKPSARYGEGFCKGIKSVGLLVVKKTWLMCPDKAAVRCPSATASKCVKIHKNQFLDFWLKQWLLNHCPGMGNDLAKELSVLVCWL
jgi:hypothetical protein